MLHKSVEWKLIRRVPKIRLMKEYGRSLRLDDDAERKLFVGAEKCGWDALTLQLFKDIIVLVRDTGTRNERELYRLRIEHINWDTKVIYVPESKTLAGRREVPMSDRVTAVLARRCGANQEGFVFPSKRSLSGHLTTIARRFREARDNAGLSKSLVLYCARHDFGSRVLARTGNLAAVMKTMGHKDVKTADEVPTSRVGIGAGFPQLGASQAAEKDCDGLEKQVRFLPPRRNFNLVSE